MAEDDLKPFVASVVYNLFSSGKVSCPISSLNLLVRVISSNPESKEPPRLRLTQLSRFNEILEALAANWDQGTLCLSREGGDVTVVDVLLTAVHKSAFGDAFLHSRKRKRVVDEEADSAAGDEPEEEEDPIEEPPRHSWSTLANLSQEQRETYAMVQKGTAKGRLLAEEVQSFSNV
jgi:mRNA (2'-O-methyladenosine-N6-)-methyltransferase